jgi:hypothetical protein
MRLSLMPYRVTTSMTRDSPRGRSRLAASRVCGIRAANGGSLVKWIGKRGDAVLAIDIDTRFVEPLAGDTTEVRQLDIRTPGFDFFRLSFESLRDAVLNPGLLPREDADAPAARFAQDLRVQPPLMMAGIGRR